MNVRFLKSRFVHNLAVVATGTAVAQAINIGASPIITRIYQPEAFGILGLFISVTTILSAVSTLSYSHAINLPREDSDARKLFAVSVTVALLFSALLLIAFMMGSGVIAPRVPGENPYWLFSLVPVVLISAAFSQAGSHWLIRKQAFYVSSRIAVIVAFIQNLAKIGFGLRWATGLVLVTVSTAAGVIAALLFTSAAGRGGAFQRDKIGSPTGRAKLRQFQDVAARYRDFPIYRTPQVLLNGLTQNLPVIGLAAMFDPAAAGLFALSHRVLLLPSDILGKAVSQVFLARFAEAVHGRDDLSRLVSRATLGLGLVGLGPLLVVVVWGPPLFGFLFGSEWIAAGQYAQWLSVLVFAHLVMRPSSQSLLIQERQRYLLYWEVFQVAAIVAMLIVGGYIARSPLVTVALYSGVRALFYGLLVVKARAVARTSGRMKTGIGSDSL
jgi:O-antigen/teichoic acid export membrane protein